jgi:SAM-dependent methyltransferase
MAGDTYHYLALYYDHLFEFRRPFEAARRALIEPLLPKVTAACDLCCGTGAWALQLAERGIRTSAVDLSPDMCRLARSKARAARLPLQVLQADMRSFRLPEPVQLVTCEFDALNHLPRKQDLPRTLAAVAAALEPGGWFVFDVNNRLAFERVWSGTWFIDRDPVAMVMHGGHEPGSDHAWTELEWFIRKGASWQRRHERVEEVCWSAAEIRQALRQAGFSSITTRDATPFFDDRFTRPGYRTFWRARKR